MLTDKEWEYYEYITKHKWAVLKAFDIMMGAENYAELQGTSLLYISEEEKLELKGRIIAHDISKFTPEEFEPYRRKFFGPSLNMGELESMNKDFTAAWEHHYNANRHHPEYFQNKDEKPTTVDIIEMMCDWCAMSITLGGDPYAYFIMKRPKLLKESPQYPWDYVGEVLKYISKGVTDLYHELHTSRLGGKHE